MTAMLPIDAAPAALRAQPSRWRRHLMVLGLAWLCIAALFARDTAHLVSIWWNSATFNHCLLVLLLIGWLVAQRLPDLRQLQPDVWTPGLLLVGAGSFGWLLGHASGIDLARHAGIVVMMQGAAVTLLGKHVSRGLAFPLFYALFLIPAGEELVPAMQRITAELCMVLLRASGIPAHLEGIFITTPFGLFEVAEACAGVKFVIAMVALGALVANLCFRSWTRRALFMAACLVVPILANGIRAWGTVYVASQTSVEYAVGFDHIVYGGIFFGAVIALVLGIAWPFFDRGVNERWFDPAALQPVAPRERPRALRHMAAALSVVLIAPLLWSAGVAASGARPVPGFAAPAVPGWTLTGEPSYPAWAPRFQGADSLHHFRYRDGAGRAVDLAVAVYAKQEEGRELTGFGQGAAGTDTGWAWTNDAPAPPGGQASRIGSRGVVREVLTFYRVGETLTGSEVDVKLETMKAKLFGGPQRAVAVLVSAPEPATGISARPALDAFVAALGPVDRLADRAAGLER